MAQATTVLTATPRAGVKRDAPYSDRLFYVVAGGAMLLLTSVGFRDFYLYGKAFGGGEITRQIVPLVVVHGLAMSCWVLLFSAQSTLIMLGKRSLHMLIGRAGALLAALILALGTSVALLSVHFNPDEYTDFGGARFFLALMLAGILLFGTFVAIGVMYRHRPEVHRPMMLLATVVVMTGPFDRWPFISDAFQHGAVAWWHWGPMVALGALLSLLHWRMTGRANRHYTLGYLGIVIACLLSSALASSAFWGRIAGIIVG